MWCALIVMFLGTANSIAGTHYSDYSGTKMSQYEGGDYDLSRDSAVLAESDTDYHSRSRDAPTLLDYNTKYEEESTTKTLQDFEGDSWKKPIRKQRRRMRPEVNDDYNTQDKYGSEDLASKFRSSRRHIKRRPRIRKWKNDRDTHINNYNRKRNEEINEFGREKVDFQEDNYQSESNPEHRPKTKKVIRRKPRRLAPGFMGNRISHRIDDEDEDDLIADTHLKKDDGIDQDFTYPFPERPTIDQYLPSDDSDLLVKLLKNKAKERSKQDSYDNKNDYYDMERVHYLNNKLSTQPRRTKARTSGTRTSSSSLLEELLSGRRANILKSTGIRLTLETSNLPSRSISSTTLSTTGPTSTSITTTSSILTTTPTGFTSTSIELSLAEKSRLSILNKVQKKENFMSVATTKPPVLLQVTKKLATMVVVEPPGSEKPLLRAREVEEDSHERLAKVKKLMRNKLIANAKNIQELTDNWDEMVCDYIDMSMLNNRGIVLFLNQHYLFITVFAVIDLCVI